VGACAGLERRTGQRSPVRSGRDQRQRGDVLDIVPTEMAPISDRTAEPSDMACSAWKQPHAIAISQKFAFNIPLQIQGSVWTVSVPSIKRVSARNTDKRLANSHLTGVSGGRFRRHNGVGGACAKSGQGEDANHAR
jgi:hypothetical protein